MDGLVLPATPFGVTPMHMPFEGTITLTPDTYMRVITETCVSTAQARRQVAADPQLARGQHPLARDRGRGAASRARHDACSPCRPATSPRSCTAIPATGSPTAARSRRWRCWRIGPTSCISTASTIRPTTRTATRWTSCGAPAAYQPVLTDIRSIAPTGWFGSPQHATAEKGRKMLTDIADAIAKEAREIFRQLDAVQGGTAEIKQLRQVELMARLLKQSEAKQLGLPGRTSLEPVSGAIGSRVHVPHRRDRGAEAGRCAARPASARRLRGVHLRARAAPARRMPRAARSRSSRATSC